MASGVYPRTEYHKEISRLGSVKRFAKQEERDKISKTNKSKGIHPPAIIKTGIPGNCLMCAKDIITYPYRAINKHLYCSKSCALKARKGYKVSDQGKANMSKGQKYKPENVTTRADKIKEINAKKRESRRVLCGDGCGELALPGRKFINKHQYNVVSKIILESQPCECGCGQFTKPGNRFIQGHNKTKGHRGKLHSAEAKDKMSKTRKEKIQNGEIIVKIPIMVGDTKETNIVLKKIADVRQRRYALGEIIPWNKGKKLGPLSAETKIKISQAQTGHPGYMLGRKHTDETKLLMSASISQAYLEGRMNTPNQYKRGYFYSVKNGKLFYYRSSYELTAYNILENDDCILAYEPEPLRIPYANIYGKLRHTVVDLLIVYINSIALIEIKPLSKMKDVNTQLKIEAMKKFSIENNYSFSLWTEKELKEILL